jgi:hypothetical protein
VTSLNVIKMVKSGRMCRAGQVGGMEEIRNAYRNLVGKPEENKPL